MCKKQDISWCFGQLIALPVKPDLFENLSFCKIKLDIGLVVIMS